jgi:hypothetical protein
VNALEEPGVADLPWSSRLTAALFKPVPALRELGRYLRYEF